MRKDRQSAVDMRALVDAESSFGKRYQIADTNFMQMVDLLDVCYETHDSWEISDTRGN